MILSPIHWVNQARERARQTPNTSPNLDTSNPDLEKRSDRATLKQLSESNFLQISPDEQKAILEISKLIQHSDKPIAIFPGKRLDPDSVGSSLAFAEFINSHFKKEAVIIVTEDIPSHLMKFTPADSVKIINLNEETINAQNYSLGVAIDIGNPGAFSKKDYALFKELEKRAQIDHHCEAENRKEMNLDVSLVDNSAPSAGTLVSKIMKLLNIPYSKSIANNLLLALNGDTGGFRYIKDSDNMPYAGHLMKQGGDNEQVFEVTNYKSEPAKALIMRALEQAKSITVNNHRLVYSYTTAQEMKENKAKYNDIQNISNELRDIYSDADQIRNRLPTLNVHMTELFDDDGNHVIKVSIRPSRDSSVDAAELVKDSKGGGHKEAAGFNIAVDESLTMNENFEKIINSKVKLKLNSY
jgi:nanoRNase/pAp phosphatase (c-di-AMP/oligoRNAs hydrolase)